MESREVQGPMAGGGLQVQQPQQMVMGPTSSSYPSNSPMINPNPTANMPPSSAQRFPFNSLASPPPPPHHQHQHHQHQHQHQHQQQPKPLDSLNSVGFDGSPQLRYNTEPAMKKKRGRPRKYDGNNSIGLQLAPTTPVASNSANHGGGGDSVGLGSSSAGAAGGGGAASEPPVKRNRGRPPGSGKRQMDALGGVGGVGFTPHVITVKAGEDIADKIVAFSRQGPRTVCILSASGAICNVTLRQPAMSGGSITYEGRFEIISLSGFILPYEKNGGINRSPNFSVSLAGSDGRVLGGGVAGVLLAASPVQVIVGSFIADGGKRQNVDVLKPGPSSMLASNMLNFGGAGTAGSSPSQGGSSESSDENGSSPINRGPGFYGNSAPSIHNNSMQMYPLWASHAPQ